MSLLSDFVGGSGSTSLIVNSKAVAGFVWDGLVSITPGLNAKDVLSGAMTANTLKTVLSVSSRGRLPLFVLQSMDTVSRTARLKITADGVVVFDYTSAANASGDYTVILGNVAAHTTSGAYPVASEGMPLVWNSSLLIEAASSLTETDKLKFHFKYHLEN